MTNERVVYFLGAGFSAPLGLPVTSNFLEKSRDLYFADAWRYPHFRSVLESIAEMSAVKNFYQTDLHNIEEILSILEMRRSLGGRQLRKAFLRYISDVVTALTPLFSPQRDGLPKKFPKVQHNWRELLFGTAQGKGRHFGYFVASLLHAYLTPRNATLHLRLHAIPMGAPDYSVITLNYDTVLERIAAYLAETFDQADFAGFSSPAQAANPHGTLLAKLHGSAETGIIVPPTWNKSITPKLRPTWNAAFRALAQANQIRILGYSLPVSDSYVRYLLRAAAIEAPHLKRIDVLCLDDLKGSVYKRYSDFVDFQNFRFVSGRTEEYMERVYSATVRAERVADDGLSFDQLEGAHERYFQEHATGH